MTNNIMIIYTYLFNDPTKQNNISSLDADYRTSWTRDIS